MKSLGESDKIGLLLFDEPRFVLQLFRCSIRLTNVTPSASLDPAAEHGT